MCESFKPFDSIDKSKLEEEERWMEASFSFDISKKPMAEVGSGFM